MIALFPALSIRQVSIKENWTWYMKEIEVLALVSNEGKFMLKNTGKLRSVSLETWTDSLLASRGWLLPKNQAKMCIRNFSRRFRQQFHLPFGKTHPAQEPDSSNEAM